MNTGIHRITVERARQVNSEGFDDSHDDRYGAVELPSAAICYIREAVNPSALRSIPPELWPWDREWWKPTDNPIRNLEKAGALIAAEIDRRLRIQEYSREERERLGY